MNAREAREREKRNERDAVKRDRRAERERRRETYSNKSDRSSTLEVEDKPKLPNARGEERSDGRVRKVSL